VTVTSVAILGAGNGGCAAAADLGDRGFDVSVYSRSEASLVHLRAQGGVRKIGACGDGLVPLRLVTTDIRQAVEGAEVVMLVVPLSAHPFYARQLAGLLSSDQIVFLNPGHMGGGLFMAHEICRLAGRRDLQFCEVTTLTYACRMREPGLVNIFHEASSVAFAAFPGKNQDRLFEIIKLLYPAITNASSVLETGFLCINAVEHPPQAVLNAGWLEDVRGDYLFYYEGTTPSVGRVIDLLDRERMEVAHAYRIPTDSFVDYFAAAGYTTKQAAATGSAYDALQNSAPNRWIKAPTSLDHRYLHEDVGWGLVPWAELGGKAGVATPVMNALITLASALNGIDYRAEGASLEKLGLADVAPGELDTYLYEGIRPQ
jgi:opine dehydrogenase